MMAFRLLPVSYVMRALPSSRAEVSGDKSARYVFHRRVYPQRRMLHFRVIYFGVPSASRVIRTWYIVIHPEGIVVDAFPSDFTAAVFHIPEYIRRRDYPVLKEHLSGTVRVVTARSLLLLMHIWPLHQDTLWTSCLESEKSAEYAPHRRPPCIHRIYCFRRLCYPFH